MAGVLLLQVSLCAVTVVQLTSSAYTGCDVGICGFKEQPPSEALMSIICEIQTAVLQLQKNVLQLQRDAARITARPNQRTGKLKLCTRKVRNLQ